MPAAMHSTTPCTSVAVVALVDSVVVVVVCVCEVVVVMVRVVNAEVMVVVVVVVVRVGAVVLDVMSPSLAQIKDRLPVTQALAVMSVPESECTPIKSQLPPPPRT